MISRTWRADCIVYEQMYINRLAISVFSERVKRSWNVCPCFYRIMQWLVVSDV